MARSAIATARIGCPTKLGSVKEGRYARSDFALARIAAGN
jgi:hypothetical protein